MKGQQETAQAPEAGYFISYVMLFRGVQDKRSGLLSQGMAAGDGVRISLSCRHHKLEYRVFFFSNLFVWHRVGKRMAPVMFTLQSLEPVTMYVSYMAKGP